MLAKQRQQSPHTQLCKAGLSIKLSLMNEFKVYASSIPHSQYFSILLVHDRRPPLPVTVAFVAVRFSATQLTSVTTRTLPRTTETTAVVCGRAMIARLVPALVAQLAMATFAIFLRFTHKGATLHAPRMPKTSRLFAYITNTKC